MRLTAVFCIVWLIGLGSPIFAQRTTPVQPKAITNSIGMELVLIPAGEFMMGSQETAEELARAFEAYEKPKASEFQDEYPQHRVRIMNPFYLGVHEVTVGQFEKFVSNTGYTTDAERNKHFHLPWARHDRTSGHRGALGFNATKGDFEVSDRYSWRQVGFPQEEDHPVVNVSHNDAVAFCAWLSRKEGHTYRLPTEAEWEYACRAGTTTRYYQGDDPEGLSDVANVADATLKTFSMVPWPWLLAGSDGYAFTAPVGKYKPNRLGLYDMHGNVWEWCADWHGAYPKGDAIDSRGPSVGSYRVVRSGAWSFGPRRTRSAVRNGFEPSFRSSDVGFRLARSVSSPPQKAAAKRPRAAAQEEGTQHQVAADQHQAAAEELGLPVTLTNSIGTQLVLIPAGEFMMGSQETAEELARAFEAHAKPQADRFRVEHPWHRVRITKPFYLGVHEVTVGEFGKFVSDTGYTTDAERNKDFEGAFAFNAATGKFEKRQSHSWRQVEFPQGENHPVVNVTHNDAVAFCEWLSRKEGQTYRLPTEAEWEYACRAGTTTRYYLGDDREGLREVANVADATLKSKFPDRVTTAGHDGYVFTAPVGDFKPNAWGLYDMHGNVLEWCADWYGAEYYEASPWDDPTGPTAGPHRLYRGGSWFSGAMLCRSAYRHWDHPSFRSSDVGFRLARSVPSR